MKKIQFVLIVLLFSLPLSGSEIELGMSAAFTGTSRGLGIELWRGSWAYFESINQSGGIQGRKVRIIALDDGYDPLRAIENTIYFIQRPETLFLFNYVGTPTVTRILPLLRHHQQNLLFLFFPFTGAQPHRQPPYKEFVFNLRASYKEETGGLVEHFLKIGRRKIAIFYQVDAYGRSGWDGVRHALARNGLEMVGEATYKRGAKFEESMQQQAEILRKSDADVVISVGSYAACAAFIRDARDSGWNVPIANVSFVGSENLVATLLEHGKRTGKDYTANLINSQVVPSYEDTSLPAVREYHEAMKRYNPQKPSVVQDDYQPLPYSFVSFEGFLNAKLLSEILKRARNPSDRAAILDAAESGTQIDLGLGEPIAYSTQEHQALHVIYYTTVQGGKFLPLTSWDRWKK